MSISTLIDTWDEEYLAIKDLLCDIGREPDSLPYNVAATTALRLHECILELERAIRHDRGAAAILAEIQQEVAAHLSQSPDSGSCRGVLISIGNKLKSHCNARTGTQY